MNLDEKDKLFSAILRDTQSEVRSYVAGFSVSLFDIDDLSQEVYLRYYENFEKKPAEVDPIKWLKGIAKNVVLSHFNKLKQKKNLSEKLMELIQKVSVTYHEHNSDDTESNVLKLKNCLKTLSEKNRIVLNYRYVKDLENKEISQKLDLSVAAVGMLLMRIRKSLYSCIKKTSI